MTPPKKDGDSLYWVVERECLRTQALVAMSHAKRGGRTVLATNKRLTAEQVDELEAAGVDVINTK